MRISDLLGIRDFCGCALLGLAAMFAPCVAIAGTVTIQDHEPYIGGKTTDSANGSNFEIGVSTSRNLSGNTSAYVRSDFAVTSDLLGLSVYGGIATLSTAANSDTFGSETPTSADASHTFSDSFELQRISVVTVKAGGHYAFYKAENFNTASAAGNYTITGPQGIVASSTFNDSHGDFYDDEVTTSLVLPKGTYHVEYGANATATGKTIYGLGNSGSAGSAESQVWTEIDAEYFPRAVWSSAMYATAHDDQNSIDVEHFSDQFEVPDDSSNFNKTYSYEIDRKAGEIELKVQGHMSGKFRNGKWALGTKYDAKITAGEGTTVAQIVSSSSFADKLVITGNADAEIPAGPLKLRGYVDGKYVGSLINDTQNVDLNIRLSTETDFATFQYTSGYNGDPSFIAPQFHRFEVDVPFNERQANLFFNIQTDDRLGLREGVLGFTADIGDTVVIDGITFADGTTPESHGLQIHLASGLPSPNLSPVPLSGDFNADGTVDAADYTVWRDNVGSNFDLNGNGNEDGDSLGVVDEADYATWKSNFGSAGSGSTSAAVPEPSTLLLALAGFSLLGIRRR
jgi:hypothetical protein